MALPRYNITIDPQNDGEEDILGLSQIAYTSTPAIITKGVYFNEIKKEMAFTDTLKLRVAAPAMIPGLPIYRKDDEMGEYEVVFSKEVIEQLREKFMANKGKEIFNLDHNQSLQADSFILDSWITGPSASDPSFTKYGIEVPEGTWFVVSQFTDKEYFQKEIIEKDRTGYSIEGLLNLAFAKFNKEEQFESYNDYPEQVKENAKIALRWVEENGWGDCGTAVGKARANQLANGENITEETIGRMAAFERHRQNSDKELGDGCGRLMWLSWGGDEGIEWAQRKLEQINNNKQEKTNMKNEMNLNELVSKLKEFGYELKLETAKLADGTEITVSKLEVGAEVTVLDENGSMVPVFDGEHLLADGQTVVTVDGKITEIKPKAEEMTEEVIAEDVVEDVVAPVMDEAKILELIQPKLDELYLIIAELKTKIDAKPEVEVELKKEEFKAKQIPSLSRLFTSIKK